MNDRTDSEIEQTLRRARFAVPAEVEGRVVGDAMGEVGSGSRIGSLSDRAIASFKGGRSRSRRVVWRRAAIVFLALGVVAAVGSYLRRPGLTWAQVRDAVGKQGWAHVKFADGGERWVNLADGARFEKDFDGRVMVTRGDGVRLWCWANGGQIFEASADAKAQPAGTSAWERIVEPYERAAGKGATTMPGAAAALGISTGVERAVDQVDGRRAVRFSSYYRDGAGRRQLREEVWADEQTRLPVQVRRWVTKVLPGGETKQESTVGRFDFPATGPATIYDLGVPLMWEVVKTDDAPAAEVLAVLRKCTAGAEKFPKRYRAVVWPADVEGNWPISLVYRDGEKTRVQEYSVPRESASSKATAAEKGGAPDLPTADRAVEWMKTQTPTNVEMWDGKNTYMRSGPFPKWMRTNVTKPVVSVIPMHWSMFPAGPEAAQWPMTGEMRGTQLAIVKADAPPGIVVLELRMQDERRQYWLDESKDFMCVKWVRFKQQLFAWKRERETRMTGIEPFHGSWLARGRETDYFGVWPLQDEPTQTEKYVVDVSVEAEIPGDAFDGKKMVGQ